MVSHISDVRVDTSTVRDLRNAKNTRIASALVLATSPPSSWSRESGVAGREGPRGVLDTACRFTVAGAKWSNAYLKLVRTLGLGHLISITPELETYKFGVGLKTYSDLHTQ